MMTQAERDRLVTLKKAKKKLIKHPAAAEELEVSVRHVRRLLERLREEGDKWVIHGLKGKPSHRRIEEETEAVKILSADVYQGFGPTLAAEYLRDEHGIEASNETVRQWMMRGKLWRAKAEKVAQIHTWRPRRSRFGEMVQWDTSEHDGLEGRGEKLYWIAMIDDATSRLWARFARHDSTAENMRLLWSYLEKFGRPLLFYTDKAGLFQTAEKRRRDEPGVDQDAVEMPPTQIGRALRELGIGWSGAHSPPAKGRVERNFGTAQDRLVKGMRKAGVNTLEQANQYFQEHYFGVVGARVDRGTEPGRRCASAAGQEPSSGGLAEPCGDAAGAQRLHPARRGPVVPDPTVLDPKWLAGRQRARGAALGRIARGSIRRALFNGDGGARRPTATEASPKGRRYF